ncbi:MAG TPA: alpha-amylase family glycosyl hydrolase [Ferruginibacter sp.]|nr:alpha-amylase family glycosyl hydrolase [Ferruginibacter sp.]
MKKNLLLAMAALLLAYTANAQLLTWSPQFPADNSTIVVTLDATKGNKGLQGFTGPVYMHLGVITNLSANATSWRYVPTTWATTTAPTATSLGDNKWSFTITNPRAYFNAANGGVPASETILKVAILFRNATGTLVQKNTDGTDMYIPIYPAGSNNIIFTKPDIVPDFNTTNEPVAVSIGQTVSLTAIATSNTGTLRLYHNGVQIAGPLTNTNTISGTATISEAGTQQIVAEMALNGNFFRDTIAFYIPVANTIAPLPPGVQEGINYWPGCDSVTLVLYAPNKQYVTVIGDFEPNNWVSQSKYQMKKTPDNNYYWITLKNLTPGVEYSFQYLVDNTIYIADPYCEKILDPWNDQFISQQTYPNLKPYPSDQNVSAGKNAFIGILQTCQPEYNWKVANFEKPDKRHLVVYELLPRDFSDARNYQSLIDSINYFKNLGINAIELMPVNEFSGNESWGYNPTFFLALDKYYGTKNKFKEFVDLCHQNGIAVILDVVYNHLDAFYAPQGRLYWDAVNGRPAANNPWLNLQAPHPYSVFQDFNHTSVATQNLVKRALEYWITEYKIDGYRFDLAKGFTQKVTNENTVEDFDGARVTNLNRYYDYIVPKYPGTYMILEFLGGQRAEEQVYASKGYLLWIKCSDPYYESAMGYTTHSDFSKVMYNSSQTAFGTPAALGYMESHDEERLMYKALAFGNASGGYNVKDTATALKRMAALAAVFLPLPGPKMIWQFGERGYDVSIFFNGDRVANKPPQWEKFAEQRRKDLYNAYAKLINLRVSNPALFNSTNFNYDFYDANGLYKKFQITDNASNGIKLNIVANLDVTAQTRTINFQNTGNWYNYLSNGTGSGVNGPTDAAFNIGATSQSITLQPGEFHVYLYHAANVYVFNGSGNWSDPANWTYGTVPPSVLPSGAEIFVNPKPGGECVLNVSQTIGQGAKLTVMQGKKIKIPLNLTIQ